VRGRRGSLNTTINNGREDSPMCRAKKTQLVRGRGSRPVSGEGRGGFSPGSLNETQREKRLCSKGCRNRGGKRWPERSPVVANESAFRERLKVLDWGALFFSEAEGAKGVAEVT